MNTEIFHILVIIQNKNNGCDEELSLSSFHNQLSTLCIISYLLSIKEEQIYYHLCQLET